MKRTRNTITDHPHTCTRCPFHLANAPGKPFDTQAARACLACKVDPKSCGLSHGGASWVSMDAAENPATVYAGRIAPEYNTAPSVFTFGGVAAETADWFKMAMCEFSALDDFGVCLLVRLFNRVPIVNTARNLNVTRQTVRERLRRILYASPHIRAAIRAARSGAFTVPTGAAKVDATGTLRGPNAGCYARRNRH